MKTLLLAALACAMSVPAGAQWITQPTRGLPRLADGKPDLKAAAPRTSDGTPDLSGIWRLDSQGFGNDVTSHLKPDDVAPSATALFKERSENLGRDHMSVLCLPLGPGYVTAGTMTKIVQTPTLIVMLNDDLTYRQIHMDGRSLEKEPNPTWMGYSVGRWDGDTLVVESNGFTERTWLDFGGHPHTEALRVIERYTRKDVGHLELQVTLEDPTLYSTSITFPVKGELVPDTELLEYVCNENEKDRARLVGTLSDDRKNAVKVAPAILATYVGTYEFHSPREPERVTMVVNVTMDKDELSIDFGGAGRMPLFSLSDTLFSGGGVRAWFVADEKGKVTELVAETVEGQLKGTRRTDKPSP